MAIRSFYKRQRLFKQMTHTQGASRGMYLRLMALSTTEIIGTIPLGTYFIVTNAKAGVTPWQGWAYTHSHYSDVPRIAGFVWKNDPSVAHGLEMFRWSLVACAFVFFAYFGFADETRQLYRRMYNSIATRIGCPRFIPHGPSYLYVVHSLHWTIWTHLNSLFFGFFCSTSVVFHERSNVTATVVTTSGESRRSSVSFAERSSIGSISVAGDIKPDFKVEKYSPSNTVASSSVASFDESKMQGRPTLPAEIMPTVPPPASVPSHFPDKTESTLRVYSGDDAV
jgi:hypothetical protein